MTYLMDNLLPSLRGRWPRNQRGTAIVELALVLPVVTALALGIITGGQAYFQKISLVDAAREGARYGASLKVADLPTWQFDVQSRIVQVSGGQLTAAQVCTALVVPTGSDTSCGVADPAGASTDPVVGAPASVVKVSVSRPAQLQAFFFTQTITLSANIAARYERDII